MSHFKSTVKMDCLTGSYRWSIETPHEAMEASRRASIDQQIAGRAFDDNAVSLPDVDEKNFKAWFVTNVVRVDPTTRSTFCRLDTDPIATAFLHLQPGA